MNNAKPSSDAFDRVIGALQDKPASAQQVRRTSARIVSGVHCEVESGGFRFSGDFSPDMGGTSKGPDPSSLGRAALSACLIMGYAIYLSRHGIAYRSIDVDIEADSDRRGMFPMGAEAVPGYTDIRVIATIDSDADEAAVAVALEESEAHSPWLYNLRNPVPVTRTLNLVQGAPAD